MPPVVAIGQHSERGRRTVNQDFHGACVPADAALAGKGVVLALADGIGSSAVSHEASEAAVRAVLEDYYCTSEAWSCKRSMQCVLEATNGWLHAQTQRSPWRHDQDRGWVCALAVLVLKGRTAHVFHAGDVRVYRLQQGRLEPLTEDHRVRVGGGQSYLSRAIGFRPRLELDYRSLPLAAGDVFVLASDGVHEHVAPAAIAAAIGTQGDDLEAAARAIVEQAVAGGSDDNVSVQVARIDALPDPDLPEARQLHDGLPPAPLLQPRATFEGYRIERELHASSRSHVYLATDLATGEAVALKTPSTDLGADAASLDRFVLEEWIARRVRSAHVLQARGGTRPRGHVYTVMEYVPGCTLAQWMRDHPAPSLDAVRELVAQVARGLQAFHRMDMLHLDLQPGNILVDAHGTAKIIDFGSVRVAGLVEGAAPGAHDAVLGTLQYTAPECLLGEAPDERADLFSLGVIAYQLLTGRLPYGTRLAAARTRAAQQRLPIASVRQARPGLPDWLDDVLRKALHPLPARRYQAVSEFVHDLHHPPASPATRRRPPLAERHPVRLWQALALLLGLVALTQCALLQQRTDARVHARDEACTPASGARCRATAPAPQ